MYFENGHGIAVGYTGYYLNLNAGLSSTWLFEFDT